MNTVVQRAQDPDAAVREMVGESSALKTAFNLVSMVAPADSSVLTLCGTGTGKADIHHPSVLMARLWRSAYPGIFNQRRSLDLAPPSFNCFFVASRTRFEPTGHGQAASCDGERCGHRAIIRRLLGVDGERLYRVSTYRNFFQPTTRWQFTGMRLAT